MKKLLLFIPIILLLISCRSNDNERKTDKLTFTNDCESMDGWENIGRSFSTNTSHSGRYSNLLNPQNCYSLTFRYRYGDLSDKKIKAVKVSVWAYFLTNNFNGKWYIVQIDSSGQKLFYHTINMNEFVKSPRTWTKIEEIVALPKKYNPNSMFGVYASNTSDDTILLDDFRIQFIE